MTVITTPTVHTAIIDWPYTRVWISRCESSMSYTPGDDVAVEDGAVYGSTVPTIDLNRLLNT